MSGYPSSALRGLVAISLLFASTACGPRAPAGDRAVELVGVVTDVHARALDEVDSFAVRAEGTSHRVFVSKRTRFAFPPGHLTEHLATAEPVRVEAERRRGKLVALSVDDG